METIGASLHSLHRELELGHCEKGVDCPALFVEESSLSGTIFCFNVGE